MKVFIDTNCFVYGLDARNEVKRAVARALIDDVTRADRLVVSPQTLNETLRVIAFGLRIMPPRDAFDYVAQLMPWCTAPLDRTTTASAWQVHRDTGFSWFDCVHLASALQAGADVFVTEDLTDGRTIGGLMIVDPFKRDPRPLARRS